MFKLRSSSINTAVKGLRNVRHYSNWPFLKEEHVMISQTCRSFADEVLSPQAGMIDKEHKYPGDAM